MWRAKWWLLVLRLFCFDGKDVLVVPKKQLTHVDTSWHKLTRVDASWHLTSHTVFFWYLQLFWTLFVATGTPCSMRSASSRCSTHPLPPGSAAKIGVDHDGCCIFLLFLPSMLERCCRYWLIASLVKASNVGGYDFIWLHNGVESEQFVVICSAKRPTKADIQTWDAFEHPNPDQLCWTVVLLQSMNWITTFKP